MKNEWNVFEDNLFNANSRSNLIAKHGYTQAMTLTVGEIEEEYKLRKLYEPLSTSR